MLTGGVLYCWECMYMYALCVRQSEDVIICEGSTSHSKQAEWA
jgi:hypothetical protein